MADAEVELNALVHAVIGELPRGRRRFSEDGARGLAADECDGVRPRLRRPGQAAGDAELQRGG